MSCLTLNITPVPPSSLVLAAPPVPSLKLTPAPSPVLKVAPGAPPVLSVKPVPQAALSVKPMPQSRLVIGEVCSISGGELVVLATQDGPLRTQNGGYLLLDPKTNS